MEKDASKGGSDRPAVDRSRGSWRDPESVASVVALAAAFLFGAIVSHGRLGSLLIDTGRELEVARRILHGQGLYSELRYYWGPLGPYLNAGLYAIFGVSSQVLAWAGLVTAAVMSGSLYLLARQFLRPWQSASATLPFIVTGAFPRMYPDAIFNFVLPFNFGATYGVTLATLGVLLLIVHVRTERTAPLVASAVLLGLVALTKLEVLFAVALTHAMFVLASPRRALAVKAAAYATSAAIVLLVYGLLYRKVGRSLWTENLGALLNAGSVKYISDTEGVTSVGVSAAIITGSLAALAAAAGAAWIAARQMTRHAAGRGPGLALATGLGVASLVAYAVMPITVPLAAVPLLALAVIGALLPGSSRVTAALRLDDPRRRTTHLLLWTFGLGLLAREILHTSPLHYGFFLIPPGVVCLAVLLYDYAPRLAGDLPADRLLFGAVGSGLLLGILAQPIRASASYFGDRDVEELVTPTTQLTLHRGSAELAIVPLLQRFPPGTRAVAIPEGVGLVFASALRGADGMFSYLPMEIGGAEEVRVLEAWRRSPPDVIVWWRREDVEFGYRGFGIDYGTRLAEWIAANYVPVTDPGVWMVVLQRRR